MNKVQRPALLFIFILLLFISNIFAQTSKESAGNSAQNTELLFNSVIKKQSLLYNGAAFQNYLSNVEGSANFQELDKFVIGSVVYQGFRFDSIPLMYDLFQDKLITIIDTYSKYSFVSDKITEFYLNNHHFKYINTPDSTKSILKSGFYDLIYDGKIKILAKRMKSMQQSLENDAVLYYFTSKTHYYIERDDKQEVISGEKSFLNYFKNRKTELKKLLKEKKIKFKKQPEVAMVLLASYYESLIN